MQNYSLRMLAFLLLLLLFQAEIQSSVKPVLFKVVEVKKSTNLQSLEFKVENCSGDIVFIKRVDADCGCKIVSFKKSVVYPGDTLSFQIFTTRADYSFNKVERIFISTNAKEVQVISIELNEVLAADF